jgi:putative colanic acid biosynthesis UDP-glucose lipid carrier transferase
MLDNTFVLLSESRGRWLGMGKMAWNWLCLGVLLILVCAMAGLTAMSSAWFFIEWLTLSYVVSVLSHMAFRWQIMRPGTNRGGFRRVLIVGSTASGKMLADRICTHNQLGLEFVGFIDDRDTSRLSNLNPGEVLGSLANLPAIVRELHVHKVYVALPISSQQRILDLTDALQDSTASLYFVPDLSGFDLIQARVDHVAGLPVLGVCESPFIGLNGFVKRLEDLAVASLLLLLLWPVLLVVALAVKLTSPGPVIFAQRRYGIDGESIEVYKFRSMVVHDDEACIRQARKNDARLTPIGGFIRRMSLDELPQFFNVLAGTMSVVGPRPHANAHNELYRHQIKGYMLRHKVKPGMTGWAQVNGWRGETESVDLMERRIAFDLDYLRNWSLWFDLKIIVMTVWTVFRDPNAY